MAGCEHLDDVHALDRRLQTKQELAVEPPPGSSPCVDSLPSPHRYEMRFLHSVSYRACCLRTPGHAFSQPATQVGSSSTYSASFVIARMFTITSLNRCQ